MTRFWSRLVAALAVALALAWAGQALSASARPRGLFMQRLGTFDSPTYVDDAPGFRRLLFVVEQPGKIAVLRNQRRLHHQFLDITGRVSFDGGERGLLSVAFPPDYRHSRRFYVYYTNVRGNLEIDEFKRMRGHPARAQPSSRRTVLVIPHPGEANHNGGQLQFGPGGYLYAGTGDGGGSDDVHDNARRRNVLLGKLLRIDPRPNGSKSYSIPPGNPYVGLPGRDEIYAYGLRNPWRFSFDRRKGALVIADVGQSAAEEVDYTSVGAAKGANFGWPQWEGRHLHDRTRPDPNPDPPRPTFPIFTYTHADGCAIIGGYVVHSPGLGSLNGRYLYTDLCRGDIRSLVPSVGAASDRGTGLRISSPRSFGQGYRGRIYVASGNGPVYRIKRAR